MMLNGVKNRKIGNDNENSQLRALNHLPATIGNLVGGKKNAKNSIAISKLPLTMVITLVFTLFFY